MRLRRPRLHSLRSRLLAGVLAVTFVGLVAADVVGVTALRSYLDQQIDTDLGVAVSALQQSLGTDGQVTRQLPADTGNCAVRIVDATGRTLSAFGSADAVPVPPVADLRRDAATGVPVTISAGETYRVRVAAITGDRFLVVSESRKWAGAVLVRLIVIELVVTVMALVLAAALAIWVSRFVLRPLDRMGATAERIADGELSHRVDLDGAPTEVARLGKSVNQMLGRIELGFTQRRLAEDRLRRFVADASHELRTPLTSITGYAQLARRGAFTDPDELSDAMRRVEDEARRMATLVDELLLLARLDQGRPLDQAPLDLAALATAAVADARAAEPGRAWRLAVEPGEHVVAGDADRLRQVVGNLLGNVRAHTPDGATAELRLSRVAGYEVVDVVDNGPGIAPDQRKQVFERFFRADSARARTAGTGEGSGLGLSIVTAIAEAHGGDASVLPHADGAWLRVRIPTAVGVADLPQEQSSLIPSQL